MKKHSLIYTMDRIGAWGCWMMAALCLAAGHGGLVAPWDGGHCGPAGMGAMGGRSRERGRGGLGIKASEFPLRHF